MKPWSDDASIAAAHAALHAAAAKASSLAAAVNAACSAGEAAAMAAYRASQEAAAEDAANALASMKVLGDDQGLRAIAKENAAREQQEQQDAGESARAGAGPDEKTAPTEE